MHIVSTQIIDAPVERVFRTIAHIEEFSKVVPYIVKVEFLSEKESGPGTRFREMRLMNGKHVAIELEVTQYVENERIRLVSDSGGTVWDTLFTVKAVEEGTELTMSMEGRAYKLMSRLMNLLIAPIVRKGVQRDMDAVKAYCQGTGG